MTRGGELSLRNSLTTVVMICAWSSVTMVGEAQRLKHETPNLLRQEAINYDRSFPQQRNAVVSKHIKHSTLVGLPLQVQHSLTKRNCSPIIYICRPFPPSSSPNISATSLTLDTWR